MSNKKENVPRFISFRVARDRNDNLIIKRSNVWKYQSQPLKFFKGGTSESSEMKIIYYTGLFLVSTIFALEITRDILPEIFFNLEELLVQTLLVFSIFFSGGVKIFKLCFDLVAQQLDKFINFTWLLLAKHHFLDYHKYSTRQQIEAEELKYFPKRKWHRGN